LELKEDETESITLDTDLQVEYIGRRRVVPLEPSPARKRKLSQNELRLNKLNSKRPQNDEVVDRNEKLSRKRNNDADNEELTKLRAEMARMSKRTATAAAKTVEANEKQMEKLRLLRIDLKNKEALLKQKEVQIVTVGCPQLSGSKRTISDSSDMTDTASYSKMSKIRDLSLEKEKELEQQIYEAKLKSLLLEKELEKHIYETNLELAVALEKVVCLLISRLV
jgi:hypothetical protein